MPYKSRSTKTKEAKYFTCLQELRAGGCDIEMPCESLQHICDLDILVGGRLSSLAVESPTGGVHYAIWTRIVARRAGPILLDCQIETPWDKQIILQSFQGKGPIYRLGSLQYPAKEVLNDKIENYLRFNFRGALVEGVILFPGLRPIPASYLDGISVPFKLTFLDQFEEEISVESELLVERRAKSKSGEARRKSGLYEPAGQNLQSSVLRPEKEIELHG
jgi:hypothetical protein